MKIAISSESTCDLSKDLLKEYQIDIIPYSIILGDDVVEDGEGVPQKIFKFVEETGKLPKTSAINEQTYEEYFEKLLKENDAVIHLTLSGGITSAVENAKRVANRMNNVFIIDSRSLSTGIGLLAIYARNLARKGLSALEIVERVEKRVPFVQASFVIEKLNYLYKGGRCNALAMFGANLLKIRPQIILKDGLMLPDKKYKGKMDIVVEQYCLDTLKNLIIQINRLYLLRTQRLLEKWF